MPPFSWASYGVQNSLSNRQCERNAMKRVVSSRRKAAQDLLHRGFQVVISQKSALTTPAQACARVRIAGSLPPPLSALAFGHNPLEDPMRDVALLARRTAVGLQDTVDEGNQRPYHRPLLLAPLARGWLRAGQRLAHHAPMHSQLAGDPLDAAHSELVICSNSSTFALLSIRKPPASSSRMLG